MTSGLPDLGESLTLAGLSTTTSMSAERLYAFASCIAHLSFPSGGEVSYSNTNYRLAQHALERQTGRALRDWLRENFFTPLGLASFDLPTDQNEVVPGLAAGNFHVEGKPRRGSDGLHFSGSGGMVASARDLIAWLRALAHGDGPLGGLFAKLAVPGVLANGEPVGYSHGFMLHRLGDRALVGHGGSLPGYKNHFLLDPAEPDAATLRASIGGAAARIWQRAAGASSAEYAGRYHCAELDARHEIVLRSDVLALRYGGGPAPDAACELRPTARDCFATTTPFNGFTRQRPALRFTRDGAGRIAGFTVSSNRSRGWHFTRT